MYVKRRFHKIAIVDENLIKSEAQTKALLARIAIKSIDNQSFTIQTLRKTQNYQGISNEYLNNMVKILAFEDNIDLIIKH